MTREQLLYKLQSLTGYKLSEYDAFMQLSTRNIQFSYNLLDILNYPGVQQIVKNRAATFLNFWLSKQINNQQSGNHYEELTFLKKILLNQQIQLRNKIIFENSISSYINSGESQQQPLEIQKMVNFVLSSEKLQMQMVGPLLYECMANSEIGRLDLIQFYKNTLHEYIKLGLKIMQILKSLNFSVSQIQIKHNIQFYEKNLKYMKSWLKSYLQSFKTLESIHKSNESSHLISQQCTNNKLIQIFLDIYQLKLHSHNKINPHQDMIFSVIGHPIEQHINQLKTYVFEINLLMIKKYQISQFNLFEYDAVLINLTQILPKLIYSLQQICRPEFNREGYQIQDTMIAGMYLLKEAIHFKFLYSRLQKQFKNVLLNIVFVLLKTSKENLILFEDSPAQFYKQDGDFFFQRQTKTVACVAKRIFQTILQIFDGAASFTFYAALGTLKYILKVGPELEIYNQIMNSNYIPTVESCLNILSLMSHIYKKRVDLQKQLISFFKIRQLFELKGIQKARHINLLICNIKQKNDPELFEKYLNWAAETTEQQPGCISYALQLLSNQLRSRIGNNIWYLFINRIQFAKLPIFFHTLQKLISKYQLQLSPEYLTELLDALSNRLLKNDLNNEIFQPILYSSIINLIKQITNCTKQLSENPKIVESAWPVFKLFQNWRTLDFLNDIIQILQNILKSIDQFYQREWSLLKLIIQIVDYQNNQYEALLSIIHLYILRSRKLILTNMEKYHEYFLSICELIQRGFSSRNKITIGQSCILYQELIMNYADILNNWDYIKLTTEQMYRKNLSNQINIRILNIWLLGYHFYNAFNIEQFCNNWYGFNNYNAKLCVFAVKKIIENNLDHETSIIKKLIITCSLILHQIKKQEENLAKIKIKSKYAKKQGKGNDDNRTYFRTTYESILYQLDLPIKKECASQLLNQIFTFLQRNNPQIGESVLYQIQNNIGIRRLKQLISLIQIKNNMRTIVKVNRKIFND